VPKFDWGISSDVINNFDRSEQQFVPYSGPIPPNGVYTFVVKRLKYVSAKDGRSIKTTLRIGLELKPRNVAEREYAGYFVMTYRAIRESNVFSYVTFLDAIGVSATDFTNRTIGTADGDIQKIGRWRHDGKQIILAQLLDKEDQNGKSRKDIGWIGPVAAPDEEEDDENDEEEFESDDTDDEDEEVDEEYDDEEDEPEPPKKVVRRTTKPSPKNAARPSNWGDARTPAPRRRKAADDIPF
jgi:hypothetical protein